MPKIARRESSSSGQNTHTVGMTPTIGPPRVVADLLLIGGGHAHIRVIRMLRRPKYRQWVYDHGIQITLITKDMNTTYSGMLAGHVAGRYRRDEIQIDLAKLCRFSGVRLIHAAVEKVTAAVCCSGSDTSGLVYCHDGRPPLRYDCLSIDIGSSPSPQGDLVAKGHGVVPVKPITGFCSHLDMLLYHYHQRSLSIEGEEYRIGVVGGGAGGVELVLNLQYRLFDSKAKFVLITKGESILSRFSKKVRATFQRILRERNIDIITEAAVIGVEDGHASHVLSTPLFPHQHGSPNSKKRVRKRLILSAASTKIHPDPIELDDCLWCVTSTAASWLTEETPFATTQDGFLRVRDTYESIHHPGVFAVGDCCQMENHPRPQAAVFAIHAAPVLLENIVNFFMSRKSLISHTPQKEVWNIISTGDEYAVASCGRWFCIEGKFLWKLKDRLDRNFMKEYTNLRDSDQTTGGIFAKVHNQAKLFQSSHASFSGSMAGSALVPRVLTSVSQQQVARARSLGREPLESIKQHDVAILPLPFYSPNGAMIHSNSFSCEIVSDTYMFGKLIAVTSLSDIHAVAASPQSALAQVVLPSTADDQVNESTLSQLLCGVSDVLQDDGVQLVSASVCIGSDLACGLSVQGFAESSSNLLRKQGGKAGDMIVLTKPIGTGALFAAEKQGKCTGELLAEALDILVASNGPASSLASRFEGIHACTNVKDLGLVGHLLEMVEVNDSNKHLDSVAAEVRIKDVPFIRGGLEASSNGILSPLTASNSTNAIAIVNHVEAFEAFPVEYPLLFDPQTAGGLLLFLDPEDCDETMLLFRTENVSASVIGRLVTFSEILDGEASSTTGVKLRAKEEQRIRIKW